MSYNITHTEYLGRGRLSIRRSEAARFRKRYKDLLPETNFLDDIEEGRGFFEIEEPLWCGEGSGMAYDLLPEILACTEGKALILFVWEGGDSQTGLEVKDGVVRTRGVKVEMEDD